MTNQIFLEHPYQRETPVRTLWYFLEPQRIHLLIAVGVFIVKHSPVWLLPLLTANIIDVVVGHRPIAQLWWNAAILVVLLGQNIPMHILYMRQLSKALRFTETRLRSDLSRQLQRLSIGYYTRASAGILQTKVVRDVEAIEQMVRQLFDGGLSAVSNLIGALVITGLRAPAFLPFFLVMVPVSAVLVRSMRKRLMERNQQFRAEIERMAQRVNEMTHLIPITRAHGLEKDELQRMDTTLSQVREAGLELDTTTGIFGSLSWVTYNIFNVVCLIVAAWVAYYEIIPISAGDVVMLTGYFSSLTNAVLGLVTLLPNISKGFESVRSIREVLEAPDLEKNAGKIPVDQVRGEIEFEAVRFQYEDTNVSAVHDFSLHVSAGENIALVGHSGAGKSTILNLVIGFIRPTAGRILLDGRDMSTIDLRTYRRFLSVVPQDSILFEGTIRENITYGMRDIRDAAVKSALRDANALEFVRELPDGMETHIGERGAKLSGGQKQRLAIARALIRNPRVLILDEATSALDVESEALIQEALARLMKGRTTFVVAHRLSTIRNADRIAVLEDGHIVEIGTHTELLEQHGIYARLQMQQNHNQAASMVFSRKLDKLKPCHAEPFGSAQDKLREASLLRCERPFGRSRTLPHTAPVLLRGGDMILVLEKAMGRELRQLDALHFYTILPIDEIGAIGFMKLTARSEYALLALVYLARKKGEGFISIETIARAQGIPPKFLEQLMLALKRAHFLRSTKGQHGGYALSKEPEQITLAEVIRLFDGALAPTESVSENFYESTPIEKEKKLTKVFKDIRDYVSQKLEKTTIADVMK